MMRGSPSEASGGYETLAQILLPAVENAIADLMSIIKDKRLNPHLPTHHIKLMRAKRALQQALELKDVLLHPELYEDDERGLKRLVERCLIYITQPSRHQRTFAFNLGLRKITPILKLRLFYAIMIKKPRGIPGCEALKYSKAEYTDAAFELPGGWD